MVEVIKRSGLREPFRIKKVKAAVIRAGASEELANRVVDKVEAKIYDGITTRDIYRIAFGILSKEKSPIASIYDLKGAIMRLGPAGYNFETYVGEIMKDRGHNVMLRQNIRGLCVEHEIDVISEERPNSYTLIECKYHNRDGICTGLKSVLYTYARYLDLCKGWKLNICNIQFESVMLATNTQFSDKAIQYGECKDMKLLGWRYPKGGGINVMIDEKKLYPITILRDMDPKSKRRFSDANILMIKDLLNTTPEDLSLKTRITEIKLKGFIEEARELVSL